MQLDLLATNDPYCARARDPNSMKGPAYLCHTDPRCCDPQLQVGAAANISREVVAVRADVASQTDAVGNLSLA